MTAAFFGSVATQPAVFPHPPFSTYPLLSIVQEWNPLYRFGSNPHQYMK